MRLLLLTAVDSSMSKGEKAYVNEDMCSVS